MGRALVAISMLLAAASSAAAEPQLKSAAAPVAATDTTAPSAVELVAAASAEPAAAPRSAEAATAAAPPAGSVARSTGHAAPAVAANVPTVEMRKLTDDTVCRKVRPTGSQIGVRRCYSPSTVAQKANDELMRRDIEEMRARQNEQQAREAAAAMSRRRVQMQ